MLHVSFVTIGWGGLTEQSPILGKAEYYPDLPFFGVGTVSGSLLPPAVKFSLARFALHVRLREWLGGS